MKIEMWPIERLVEYARNPRKNDRAVDKVAAAIKEFGFRVPVIAKSDGLIVDGHLRYKAAKKLKLKEIPIMLADDLSDAQIKAFRISVNKLAELAEWDDELLKIELEELKSLDYDLSLTGFDADVAIEGFAEPKPQEDNNPYTKKIESPVYTPTGPCPEIKELFDDSKTKELISEIKKADIPTPLKKFLELAAHRHTVFDYQNIAEYYAHAPKEVQELMENSALVIIDFNKAIEKGFVVLSEALAEAFDDAL